MSWVPLWCKSNFSFLEGASHPEELVEAAAALGLPALALTDRDGVHGIVRAHVRAKELAEERGNEGGELGGARAPKLLVGSEVTVDDGSTIVLLAQDRHGYGRLCRLLTRGRRRCDKGDSRVGWDEVAEHAEGLIALWGGERSLLTAEANDRSEGAPPCPGPPRTLRAPPLHRIADQLREAFGDRLYALAARHLRAAERPREARLRARAAAWGLPVVAGVEVLYHDRARRPLQDVLAAIRHGVRVQEAGRRLAPNAEHVLHPPEEAAALFSDDPEALARTREVAERCDLALDELRYRYPSETPRGQGPARAPPEPLGLPGALPDGTTSSEWLALLAREGAERRWPDGLPDDVRAQLDRELALIDELDYAGYFLTMHRLVEFCRARGILCQGRGSAANSVVCYALGITAIDPMRMDLLFERFISRERHEPPDIDLDIEHERREEAIQHVFEAYGRDRAAMVANVIRYRPRSAIRDVGKALGFSETTLDGLARLLDARGALDGDTLQQAGLAPEAPASRQLRHLADEILGFPRHLSLHPGGFLLGHEPVCELVPIENAAMEGRTVVQWDKDDLEDLGLFKVDLLGLGALSHLHRGLELLRTHHGIELGPEGAWSGMAAIPHDDPETFSMIRRAETVGVFQIESRAQMAMLPRLGPERFYDLVIEVSIVRPGPITGGMVHPYLRRRRGEEAVHYPHPVLRPILEKTLGVPLFQEQVMKLAMATADYTPGEADRLRRDMAAWRKTGRMERHRERLVSRMVEKGIRQRFAEAVFEQIRGFGEYGFPESHAASFALIAYATAWLKCHYPAAFHAALLNSQPLGFYAPATIVHDAQRQGVEIRPVDVRESAIDCTLEPDAAHTPETPSYAVRMGLRYVKGLAARDREALTGARARGAFDSLADLVRRTGLGEGALVQLAEAGAFAGFGLGRREALWTVRRLARTAEVPLPLDRPEPAPDLPALDTLAHIVWDYRTAEHSPRGHLLGPFRPHLRAQGLPDARGLEALPHGTRTAYVGLVVVRQRPETAGGVVFMTLEDEAGLVNGIVWPDVFERYRVLARTEPLLGIYGRIQRESGVTHLVAEHLWRPDLPLRSDAPSSRDFH